MLFSNNDGMQTKSLVQRRAKHSAAKASVFCPDVIKFYYEVMNEVDLVDQRTAAYHLDKKFNIRFYLRIFFDLMDGAYANSYIAYNILHPDDLILLNFKTALATLMIGLTLSEREPIQIISDLKEHIDTKTSQLKYQTTLQGVNKTTIDVFIVMHGS